MIRRMPTDWEQRRCSARWNLSSRGVRRSDGRRRAKSFATGESDAPVVVFTPLLERAHRCPLRATYTDTRICGEIEAWRRAGGGAWHLAIDTGMSRAGFHGAKWTRRAPRAVVPPEGAFTHFHSAELDNGTVAAQEKLFRAAIASLPSRPRLLHTDNSAAIARKGRSDWDLVRPGIFLYGVGSGRSAAVQPEPVVHLRAIVEIRNLEAW